LKRVTIANSEMRVLMITTSYPKYAGDVTAPMIEKIVLELARRRHAVDLVLPRHPDLVLRGRDRGLPVRFFPFYAGSGKSYAWGYASSMRADRELRPQALVIAPVAFLAGLAMMRRLAANNRYDVIHAHWVVPNGLIAALAAGRDGPPLVISLHGSDVFVAERNRVLASVARWTFRRASWVTACASDLRERALRVGAAAERVGTLPYGVDVGEVANGDADEWRRRAGAGEDDFLVVGLGRLVAKKGFQHLLRAVASLSARGVPVRAVIGGTGDLRTRLEAEAGALTCRDRIRFLGDVPHSEIGGLFRAADVVAVPSVRDEKGNVDGLPNVLLEAMAAARPIVATRIAGIPDVVDDGENGLLVAAGVDDALADAMARLYADRELAGRLGAAAMEKARALSWQSYGDRLLSGYEQAIRGARRG
jgi:glycosyltransferase involved in cell wall biosynthesis